MKKLLSRRSSGRIRACRSCGPFGKVRSKPRHSTRGRISPSSATSDFSPRQVTCGACRSGTDRQGLRRSDTGHTCRKHRAAAAAGSRAHRRDGDHPPQHPVIRSCDDRRNAAASHGVVRRIRRADLRRRSRGLRPRRPAGAERPELPRADGPQRGAGVRRADRRHERKRHPFGRAAGPCPSWRAEDCRLRRSMSPGSSAR